MVANCARAVPTEYSLSASDPLTSSTLHLLKSANKRTPASHQLHRTHQPLPQSGIAQLSCFQKRLLTPHQSKAFLTAAIFSLTGLREIQLPDPLSSLQPNVRCHHHRTLLLQSFLDSRNLPPWAISEPHRDRRVAGRLFVNRGMQLQ